MLPVAKKQDRFETRETHSGKQTCIGQRKYWSKLSNSTGPTSEEKTPKKPER
jgi:hypothetical protein